MACFCAHTTQKLSLLWQLPRKLSCCVPMDPQTHFDQSLGLAMSTSIGSHLLRTHNRASRLKSVNHCTDDGTAFTSSVTTIGPLPHPSPGQIIHLTRLCMEPVATRSVFPRTLMGKTLARQEGCYPVLNVTHVTSSKRISS